jgi:hypothetical protein
MRITVKPELIQARSSLWVAWARIAFEHETIAQAARQQALALGVAHRQALQQGDAGEKVTQLGTDLAHALSREMHAALVGICAAAFALEALSRELRGLGVAPPELDAAWQAKKLPTHNRLLERLKRTVDPSGLVDAWQRELRWLFALRGGAVHNEGSFEPMRPHPAGSDVSVAEDTYSAENCTRAADLLVSILERCRDRPKPPGNQWSMENAGSSTS